MTTLEIKPRWADKTARFRGTVAAGEVVAVTVKGAAGWINGNALRLRVVDECGYTVAQFPIPEDVYDSDTMPPNEWDFAGGENEDATCRLSLNTDQMRRCVPHGTRMLLFVLDDPTQGSGILYFKDLCEVTHWPDRTGEDSPAPIDLGNYRNFLQEAREAMADAAETAQDAANDAATSVERVSAALDTASNFVDRAETAATNAQNSANGAGNAKLDAEAAQTAAETAQGKAEAAQTAAETAQGKAEDAQAAAELAASNAQGHADDAQGYAEDAGNAAAEAVATEKTRAEGAESDLQDAIDAEELRAKTAESLAIVGAEYVSNDQGNNIVFTTAGGSTIKVDASAFIKDGMISSVSVSNGNLVIAFNSDAGKQPISIPISSIFNPSNYYNKTAADERFMQRDGAKGLSTNDYTNEEKSKLAGIANNANNYTLPPATAQTLGGVKVGANLSIDANGVLSATGGSSVTVDDELSDSSENPVQNKVVKAALNGKATSAQGAKADRAVLYREDDATSVDIGRRAKDTTVGLYSVVEGEENTASGNTSHAEGAYTTASGDVSHAEGEENTASGDFSHAEGANTTAQNEAEHAQGKFNVSHKANTTFGNAGNTLSSIGFGLDALHKKNAVETMQDGKTFFYGVGGYDGKNPNGNGVKDIAAEINAKENTSNKVASLSAQSTDVQYPSAKCVYDRLAGKADASSLPYALVDVTIENTLYLPDSAFPITYYSKIREENVTCTGMDDGVSIFSDGLDGYEMDVGGEMVAHFLSDGSFDGTMSDAENLLFNGQSSATLSFANTAALADRASSAVSLTESATLAFPAQTAGNARDFVVRLTLTETNDVVPSVTFPADVAYETEGGEWPDLTEAGTYIVRLTEVPKASESETARFFLQCSSAVADATPPSAGGAA